jgi:fructokinase
MVCVIGEALIDLVSTGETEASGDRGYLAHPGGSPYNVAIGLARLGNQATLLARLSGDAFGRQLRSHAEANGVDLSLAVEASEPSTLAVLSLDAAHNATYDFYRTGTADWQWSAAEMGQIPADTGWVHTGSLASWISPGAEVIESRLTELASSVVSFDPNIRPLLLTDHAAAVGRIERLVALSTVVKASAEDLEWLYPDEAIPDVLHRWRALGPSLVVVTDGGRGAHAMSGDGQPFTVAARQVTVVDTVGAGDAFMAGLINALEREPGLIGADAGTVTPAIEEAILVAALTCQRAGADPPTAAELAAAAAAG